MAERSIRQNASPATWLSAAHSVPRRPRRKRDNRYSLFFSGMRNPYDFAFNLAGEAFTFDSDMEWDVNSPC